MADDEATIKRPLIDSQQTLESLDRFRPLPSHAIAAAVTAFVHRARDTKLAARRFVPASALDLVQSLKTEMGKMESARKETESDEPETRASGIRTLDRQMVLIRRLMMSNVPLIVERSLFLGLFSAYDAFIGELIRATYTQKPLLFRGLDRSIPLGYVLQAQSLDDLKKAVLDEEIEQLRRESYIEQFAMLSRRFEIKLTEFDNWPAFVERSQRRNLITHCDGIVSDQYRQLCIAHHVPSDQIPPIGTRLGLGLRYLLESCELLIETAIKLGQTLWRKLLPEETADADEHLKSLLYESLQGEQWKRAAMIGEFALGQRRLASDLNRRILIVNQAQALKWSGRQPECLTLLESVDWSAVAPDFRLAAAVLRDDYGEAARLMRHIGLRGELVTEHGYLTWPLFREFRTNPDFATAFEEVYGYKFVERLAKEVVATERDATQVSEVVQRQEETQPLPLPEVGTADQ